MSLKTNKTVYILGAGFSYPHAPCQSKILEEVLNLSGDNSDTTNSSYEKSRNNILCFINELFNPIDIKNIILEDILTLLDKAILTNEYIRNYDPQTLKTYRNDLVYCIAYAFDIKLKGNPPSFYVKLSDKIVEKRISANEDKFSFIVLNWDLLLDNQIKNATEEVNREAEMDGKEGEEKLTSIDYCAYTNEFEPYSRNIGIRFDPYIPDIHLSAYGFKNIKVLKLHGSFNWLICKNCNRLLKTFNRKIILNASDFIKKSNCFYCDQNSLEPVIITPTLLKDFNNVHLKTIWHNAEIELMEAKRIVFVGYSFPIADYEFRYVLKRCISKEAEVVLALKEDKDANNRYLNFFGNQIKNKNHFRSSAEEFFRKEFEF